MSNPSAATRQRVPTHFASNGRFLEASAWIKVAGNVLASFEANRHMFLRIGQRARTRQRSALDCSVGLPFLREAEGISYLRILPKISDDPFGSTDAIRPLALPSGQ